MASSVINMSRSMDTTVAGVENVDSDISVVLGLFRIGTTLLQELSEARHMSSCGWKLSSNQV